MIRLTCLVSALALSAACGGDDDGGAACEDFAACGGDPVGSWTIEESCISGAEFDPGIDGCPEATGSIDNFTISGSVDVEEGGTYTSNVTSSATVSFVIPVSCLGGQTCADLAAAAEVECVESGDNCECEDTNEQTDNTSGTWAASGNTLTLDEDPAEFCVDGNQMSVRPEVEAGAPVITLVLTR